MCYLLKPQAFFFFLQRNFQVICIVLYHLQRKFADRKLICFFPENFSWQWAPADFASRLRVEVFCNSQPRILILNFTCNPAWMGFILCLKVFFRLRINWSREFQCLVQLSLEWYRITSCSIWCWIWKFYVIIIPCVRYYAGIDSDFVCFCGNFASFSLWDSRAVIFVSSVSSCSCGKCSDTNYNINNLRYGFEIFFMCEASKYYFEQY